MRKNTISAIAAIGKNTRALGKTMLFLWRISEDLKRFKKLTSGHPIVMGRKTFESIGRALPNRTNIVITRNADFKAENVLIAHSIEDAIEQAKKAAGNEEIFVIGGGEIYRAALPFCDRLYLTLVDSDLPGDAFFPEYGDFKTVTEDLPGVSENPAHRYLTIER